MNPYYESLGAQQGEIPLPNGCTLFWKRNEVGGIDYTSDEIGGGVEVWNSALVDGYTLLAAIAHEHAIQVYDAHQKRKDHQ